MFKKRVTLIIGFAITVLQGCSSEETPQGWNIPPLEGNTGSVSANFVATDVRYFFKSDSIRGITTDAFQGTAISYVQQDGGAVTEIVNSLGSLSIAAPADNQLPVEGVMLPNEQTPDVYSPIIKEISGDAYFAMGRWAVGSATVIDETALLHVNYDAPFEDYIYFEGMHYLLMNQVSVFPETGTLTCDTGHFTQGTYYQGVYNIPKPLTITGNATLYFDGTGAHFSINLHATMTHYNYVVSGDQTYASALTSPSSISYPNGSAVMVGEGGNGSYLLGGRHTITTDIGADYNGVMVFRCQ